MKTTTTRRELLKGYDATAADVDRPPQILSGVRDCILTNGRGTKRLGHTRYTTAALRRGMLCQRGEQVGAFRKANKVGEVLLRKRSYPPLGYGLIPWHVNWQPVKAGWAIDLRLFTGRFESGRAATILDQSIDTGGAQWSQIRRALRIEINAAGNIVVTMDRYDRTTNAYTAFTVTSAAPTTVETDLHIGISYDTANFSLRLNGGAAVNTALAFNADQFWAGESCTDGANTENDFRAPVILLNTLYVRRSKATATFDDATPANPYDWFALYPNQLDAAPAGAGIYEIRRWNTSKDFSAGSYLSANRPLTAAEEADTALVSYLRCDEGGGRIARDTKGGHHARLMPGGPIWVDQTGFGSNYAVEVLDGACLRYRAQRNVAEIDPLNRELEFLFGDVNSGGGVAPTRCAPYTVQILFRTPKQFELEPQQTYVTANGAPFNNHVLATVTKGSVSATPNDNNRLDRSNLSPADTLNVFQLFLSRTAGTMLVQFSDNGSLLTSATALAADTDYTLTVTRSETGTRSIYINAATAADATAAGMPNFQTSGSATTVTIGRDYDAARSIVRATANAISRCERNLDGIFRFKAFRVWKTVLRTSERTAYAGRMLLESERSNADLLVNLEVTSITGLEVPSRCSYPVKFTFEQAQSEHHLGNGGANPRLSEEWWDSWSNAQPPYWGSHAASTTYDPVGAEGQIEAVADYKDAGQGDSHLLAAAHGILYVDKAFTGTPIPTVPERYPALRDLVRHADGDRLRPVQAAGRVLLLSEMNSPMVWTGRHLVPLGVDLPKPSGLPEGTPTPLTGSANVTGQMVAGVYSYMLVYRDEERNVIGVLGPLQAQRLAGASNVLLGTNNTDVATPVNENDMRCIRKHLNPRVSSIELYRNHGEGIANTDAGVNAAEAGPFYFHSTLSNIDQAGIDTLRDSELGTDVLDDRFTSPPPAKHAAVFNGHMILANFPLARDFVLPSQGSGKIELFDEEEGFPTEDGTNGEVTGLRTAYGSCWAFKERSIWQLNETADGLIEGVEFTRAVGCVAPDTLVEFFSQATGQRSFFFWSSIGPYLFNGNQPQYIGQPLKGDPALTPFFDLQLSAIKDLWAVDVEQLGQIWVFAKPSTTEAQLYSPEYRKVLAYDYINGVWLLHSGLRFTAMAPINVPSSLTVGGIAGSDRSSILFAGGYRGYLYTVLTSTRGGDSPLSGNTLTATVDAASTVSLLTAATGTPWIGTHLRDLVALLLHADGTVESRWILSNTSTTITPEKDFTAVSAAGTDAVLVAPIDFLLELPFDALDLPQVDKHVSLLTTVSDGLLYWRTSVNQRALTGPWVPNALTDPNKDRRKVWINRMAQAIKLELRNPFPDSPCVLYAWEWDHSPTRSGVTRQVVV